MQVWTHVKKTLIYLLIRHARNKNGLFYMLNQWPCSPLASLINYAIFIIIFIDIIIMRVQLS